ncbi:hypothetical protein LINPERPRIM_LOCUS17357 [Linum perenne]
MASLRVSDWLGTLDFVRCSCNQTRRQPLHLSWMRDHHNTNTRMRCLPSEN